MRVTIVGVKDVEFTNKATGNLVQGQNIFFEYADRNTVGMATDKVFLSRALKLEIIPSLPCEAEIYYNRYGKVDEFILSR